MSLSNKKILSWLLTFSIIIYFAQNVYSITPNENLVRERIFRNTSKAACLYALKNEEITINFQEITNYPCLSPTLTEMPIVTALEKNGDARICVTCMDSNNQGRLTIFGPPLGQRWAPARNIWHQYAYNPLFINDDGTGFNCNWCIFFRSCSSGCKKRNIAFSLFQPLLLAQTK